MIYDKKYYGGENNLLLPCGNYLLNQRVGNSNRIEKETEIKVYSQNLKDVGVLIDYSEFEADNGFMLKTMSGEIIWKSDIITPPGGEETLDESEIINFKTATEIIGNVRIVPEGCKNIEDYELEIINNYDGKELKLNIDMIDDPWIIEIQNSSGIQMNFIQKTYAILNENFMAGELEDIKKYDNKIIKLFTNNKIYCFEII